jgi:hypothetical protein
MRQLLADRRKVLGGIGTVAFIAVAVPLALPQWSADQLQQAQNLQLAIYDVQAAVGLVKRYGGALAPEATEQVLALYERAASNAINIDEALLAKVHEDLPEVWRGAFRKSTDIYVLALKNRDRDAARQAALLQDDWLRWYSKNKSDLNLPPASKAVSASATAQ